jgi:hypothetical protein
MVVHANDELTRFLGRKMICRLLEQLKITNLNGAEGKIFSRAPSSLHTHTRVGYTAPSNCNEVITVIVITHLTRYLCEPEKRVGSASFFVSFNP